jgi:hypothetical protein
MERYFNTVKIKSNIIVNTHRLLESNSWPEKILNRFSGGKSKNAMVK